MMPENRRWTLGRHGAAEGTVHGFLLFSWRSQPWDGFGPVQCRV